MAGSWLREWCLKEPRWDELFAAQSHLQGPQIDSTESAIITWRRVYRSHGSVGIWASTFHPSPSQLASRTATAPTFGVYLSSVSSPAFDSFAKRSIYCLFLSYLLLPFILFHSASLEEKEDKGKDFQTLWLKNMILKTRDVLLCNPQQGA